MSDIYEPLSVTSWLDVCRETEPGVYTPTLSHPTTPSHTTTPPHPKTHSHHRSSVSDTPIFARAPPTWPPNSVRRRPRSPSTLSEPAPTRTQLPYLLNSGCRSTWELLKALPDPSDVMKVLPTLPTHYFTPSELDSQLPDPFLAPLAPSIFKSVTAVDAVYRGVLDLRECLRVEEITIEMKTDMERLYLDPPIYRAYQERLGDVRVLLMRACQSLSYIETESLSYGINLDIAAIDERRIANRPASHPFNMIVTYLNPTALEDFHNYESFSLSATRFDSRDTPHLISEPQGEEDVNMEMREQGSEADEVEDEDIDEDDDEDKDEDDEEDEDEDQINDKGDDDEDDEDSEEEDEEEEDEDDTKGDEEEEEGYQMQIERTVEAVDSNTSDDSPLLSQHSLVLPNHRNRHRPKGKPIQQHNLHPVIASYPWETVRGNEQMWSYQRTHYIIT